MLGPVVLAALTLITGLAAPVVDRDGVCIIT